MSRSIAFWRSVKLGTDEALVDARYGDRMLCPGCGVVLLAQPGQWFDMSQYADGTVRIESCGEKVHECAATQP